MPVANLYPIQQNTCVSYDTVPVREKNMPVTYLYFTEQNTCVYNHLIQNKLIYQYQSGFLPKHSSVHQLIELYNTILSSLENKNYVASFSVISQRLSIKFGTKV